MKVIILAVLVALVAGAPIEDGLDISPSENVNVIVNGVSEGEALEIAHLLDIELNEHSVGVVATSNVLQPLSAAAIAEAAVVAEQELAVVIPDAAILPLPVSPQVIVPDAVALPLPVAPEVVFPDAAVLPLPVTPEVVIPDAAVLPLPIAPEVMIPDAAVLPLPVAPEVVVSDAAVLPLPVAPEVVIPDAAALPLPVAPEFIIPDAAILPLPVTPDVVVPDAAVLPLPVNPEVVIPETVPVAVPELVVPGATPDLVIPDAVETPAAPAPAPADTPLTGDLYNDGVVQVIVNTPEEPTILSTLSSWMSLAISYVTGGVQTTAHIV